MLEPGGHCAQCNKPVIVKFTEAESRTVVIRGQEEGKSSNGYGVSVMQDEFVLETPCLCLWLVVLYYALGLSSVFLNCKCLYHKQNKTRTGTQGNTKVMDRSVVLVLW